MMSRNDCDWVNKHFASSSLDITPQSVRHAAQLLYVPVSSNPEVTKCCTTVLSDNELQTAGRFAAQADRNLFIQRRAFRRYCGALAFGLPLPLSQVIFEETENGRPYLCDLPGFWFGFSSCRLGFTGAWSSTHAVGVDFEDLTRGLETIELARQFFTNAEAVAVEQAGNVDRQWVFLQLWMLKEAALKSIGEGLPFGLDAFDFELAPKLRTVQVPANHGGPEQYDVHVIKGAESCASLVIRKHA
jgi:4'-phosphopantetheinyl transferase